MILAIGYLSERTFGHFVTNLNISGVGHKVFDLNILKNSTKIEVINDFNNDNISITVDKISYSLNEFDSFYLRLFYSDLGDSNKNEAFSNLITSVYSYLQNSSKTIINKPSSGDSNINKFIHSKILEEFGFNTIDSFLSNDFDYVISKVKPDSTWVIKGISSVKTKAAYIEHYLFSRLGRLHYCPCLFQSRIFGDNVRVHMVGRKYFAERIKSERFDYRFADDELSDNIYYAIDIPNNIYQMCLSYCIAENLIFAGFDFLVTENNEWFILECNTMPGYETYDKRCRNSISKALINVLDKGLSNFHKLQKIEALEASNSEPVIPNANRPNINF